MAALVRCLMLVFVSAPFHQRSEAISHAEAYHVSIAYSPELDTCKGISDSSSFESKTAADHACKEAFSSLDRIGRNTCRGWRNAGCRLVFGQKHPQCTCLVSYCDGSGITNHIPKTIRQCATKIEERTGVTPTTHFKQSRRKHNHASQVIRLRCGIGYTDRYGGTGSSKGVLFASGEGTSSGVPIITPEALQSLSVGPVKLNGPRPFPCSICPRGYSTQKALKEHMKSHKTKVTECPVCHQIFATKGNLKPHIQRAHPGTPLPKNEVRGRVSETRPNEAGLFVCETCGKRYASACKLKDHEKSHTLDTHCSLCRVTLGSGASYRDHMRKKHPLHALAEEAARNERFEQENPEVCGTCKKRFKNPEGLRQHQMLHDGLTNCDICGLTLPRKSSIYKHKKQAHPK